MATIKYLTPTVVERIFSTEIGKLSEIEGVYDNLKPEETVKYLFKLPLQLASIVTETLPECTGKLSFVIFARTWELLDQQVQLDDTIRDILRGLVQIRDIIEVLGQASSAVLSNANRLKEPINNILVLLEDASVHICDKLSTKDLAHIAHAEGGQNDSYDVQSYLTGLATQQKAFHTSWSFSTISPTNQTSLIEDESTALSCTDNQITADTPTAKLTDPNGYDPDRACIDGTREAILNRIVAWTQSQDNSESFMWISGQAGMGKTSVATSLCDRLDRIGALAGCFFCQRDNPNTSDPLQLINNLVHEIAMQCPAYAYEASYAIRANRKLCTSHLRLRYEGLIKAPLEKLKSLSMPKTLVVVIDALDECGEHSIRQKILDKLHDMSRLVPWLKVVFTSQPEGSIHRYFTKNCTNEIIIHLQTYDASEDIRVYIEEQLGELAQSKHWPQGSLDQLCAGTQGVFLWAVRATHYIQASTLPSLLCLRKVLENRKSPVTDHFDALYTRVLMTAMNNYEDDVLEAYSRCIGAILATSQRGNLTIAGLQHLLLVASRIDGRTLERIMMDLGPLLIVTDGQYARFYHSSFKDYITDRSRSSDFSINVEEYEVEPAECCFKVMQQDLRFNICELKSSSLLNNQVSDLKLQVHSHITPALKYACIHWIDHFIASPNQNLVNSLKRFLEGPRFMYWIEVLSLLGRLDVAIERLSEFLSLELVRYIPFRYLHHFLLSFHDAIAASTPHLYVSALAFAPTESLTARRMRPYFPNTINISQGADSTWHPCIKTVIHPHAVQSLSVSSDGLRIVAAYPDGSLSIWDKKTGDFIGKPIIGHTNSVTCVLFSPDDGLVASSSYDATIRVWNAAPRPSLNTIHVLTGHRGSVHSIAFSPNASIIASGSSDKTIRLWNTRSGCSIGEPYVGHSSRVSSVAFSPDGTKMVSASWDKTIRVWSANTSDQKLAGHPLLITGHSGSVTCITFSPDGSKIASGSVDTTVRLWDLQGGGKVESIASLTKHPDSINSIAFSPNGKLIASCSIDGMVRLWDPTKLTEFFPFIQPF
ncbi:WD40-repeat protein (notchless protein), related protein, putative [Rhizoctonia solani AG-3 Rhs1AP]|uniref:WD40-repeat protein (Notchless protein), related protein, putative n=1 Tax=Rhizoctonia solani AG-3 Rhs1AP TaxID=1086054 RepID=X8J9X2_9AGAM|nr:WD40-repeat protein (notchless protein), related protein, putative [Rhizoctonia solani AG-3 Rhs1AP]